MNRRAFLKKVAKSFFLILSISIAPLLSYLYPVRIKEKALRFFAIAKEEDLPERGVKRVDFSYEKNGRKINTNIYLVQSKEGLIVLSPVCTHLGCIVKWSDIKKEFLCPCHGGRYASDGRVIGGPPPAPLNRLPLEIREGIVYIGLKV